MKRINENNTVNLTGEIVSDFQFNHEVFGEKFYRTELAVRRNSEYVDYLPLVVSERLADVSADWKGQIVKVFGQFRSFNKHEGDKSRLVLSVFAKDIEVIEENAFVSENEIYLRGYICKEPVCRKTPRGREIADVLIAINRSYGKSDYIPCILWGGNARYAETLEVGTQLELWGRIQSREYLKRYEDGTEEVRTAYEVSVNTLEV